MRDRRIKAFDGVYAEPAARRNVFTVYMGDFFSIDYADAKTRMPPYVMQTFGGTVPRYDLAESVLGFERFSWDTRLKIVNNLELRFNLPAVFFKDLVPGLLAYFDIGYGAGYWGDASETKGGFLASAGLGAYVDLFDIVYLRVYTHFPVIGEKLDGDSLDLDLNFNLHF